MDSECNIRVSESEEVQKWERRLTSFKDFLSRFSKTETKAASKHLFQKQYATRQFTSKNCTETLFNIHNSFDQNASVFTIDLGIQAQEPRKQQASGGMHLKKQPHRKKGTTITKEPLDIRCLIVERGTIYGSYRVIQLIHRFRSRQLFIISKRQSAQKMMMRVVFKMEFRDEQLIKGESEIANFTLTDHEAFPKLKQVYEECNKYFLVFQHTEGITLTQFINKYTITEDIARIILRQLLEALDHLHHCEIVHRDIRPDNILVTNYQQDVHSLKLQIIDMSLSASLTLLKRDRQKVTGLSYYASPQSKNGFINQKYDVWSVGILSIVLLAKFQEMEEDPELYLQAIANRSHLFLEHAKNIPKKSAEFINSLLISRHVYRPTAAQALKHGWINNAPASARSIRSYRRVDLEPFIPIST